MAKRGMHPGECHTCDARLTKFRVTGRTSDKVFREFCSTTCCDWFQDMLARGVDNMYIQTARTNTKETFFTSAARKEHRLTPVPVAILRRMTPGVAYVASELGWLNWGTYKARTVGKHKFPYAPQNLARMSGKPVGVLKEHSLVWTVVEGGLVKTKLSQKGIELQKLLGRQVRNKKEVWVDTYE